MMKIKKWKVEVKEIVKNYLGSFIYMSLNIMLQLLINR